MQHENPVRDDDETLYERKGTTMKNDSVVGEGGGGGGQEGEEGEGGEEGEEGEYLDR